MEGIQRLKTEVLEMNDYNVVKIFKYLINKQNLYENFNNEEKSMRQMLDYIYNKANKLKKNNIAMVEDRIVYLWAEEYFTKSNAELGIKEKQSVAPTKNTEKNEGNNEKVKKEIAKEQEEQISMFQEVQD